MDTQSGKEAWTDKDAIAKTNPVGKQQHVALEDKDVRKESGKDIGLVDGPLVSINPTSGSQSVSGNADGDKNKTYKIFDHANQRLNPVLNTAPLTFSYPFDKLEIDQGFFVPVEKGMTTDKLMDTIHDQINSFREQGAECEKDKDGNDVWECVLILTKKRLDDGTIELDSFNKPIVGANQTNRPKLIYSCNFIARPVVKGDNLLDEGKGEQKAESDGVLVVRVI